MYVCRLLPSRATQFYSILFGSRPIKKLAILDEDQLSPRLKQSITEAEWQAVDQQCSESETSVDIDSDIHAETERDSNGDSDSDSDSESKFEAYTERDNEVDELADIDGL